MRKHTWVALGLAFAMLVAIPAQAGTRKAAPTKVKRSGPGFMVVNEPMGDPQQKLFWCIFGRYPDYIPGMPNQPASPSVINFGVGWAVYEQVQSVRNRDLQYGTLTLQKWNGAAWDDVYNLSWTDGRWDANSTILPPGASVGDYAWSDPYPFVAGNGAEYWRIDWELPVALSAGSYRFTNVDFGLSAGSVEIGGGDPPGPWMTYSDCQFGVGV